jgi:hypothetical protein
MLRFGKKPWPKAPYVSKCTRQTNVCEVDFKPRDGRLCDAFALSNSHLSFEAFNIDEEVNDVTVREIILGDLRMAYLIGLLEVQQGVAIVQPRSASSHCWCSNWVI